MFETEKEKNQAIGEKEETNETKTRPQMNALNHTVPDCPVLNLSLINKKSS